MKKSTAIWIGGAVTGFCCGLLLYYKNWDVAFGLAIYGIMTSISSLGSIVEDVKRYHDCDHED